MKRKYRLSRIVNKRAYTTEEIAELFNIHTQTVRQWRKEGLEPLEENASPYLFLGQDLKNFLLKQREKFTPKLKEGEFYCLKCKKAVLPVSVQQIDRNVSVGDHKKSYFLVSTCPLCGIGIRRFTTIKIELPRPVSVDVTNQSEKTGTKAMEQLSLFGFQSQENTSKESEKVQRSK